MTQTQMTARTTDEAIAIVRTLHPDAAVIDAMECTYNNADAYDVLVWDSEALADNDDGATATARYTIAAE